MSWLAIILALLPLLESFLTWLLSIIGPPIPPPAPTPAKILNTRQRALTLLVLNKVYKIRAAVRELGIDPDSQEVQDADK